MGKKLTTIFLVALSIVLILYDVWGTMQGYQYTITHVIRTISEKAFVVPFGIGILLGYWLGKVKIGMTKKQLMRMKMKEDK
jgi:hypothetical protein